MAKLVILRGPSGSGKSTVAGLLHQRVLRKTALIEQDYYRHKMFNNPHTELEAARQIMCAGIIAALDHGYDVICEGILSMGKYKSYFDELLAKHPEENYFFFFDISIEETVRRHATRSKREHFGEAELRDWYTRATPSDYAGEVIISEDATAEEVCARIVALTGLPTTGA